MTLAGSFGYKTHLRTRYHFCFNINLSWKKAQKTIITPCGIVLFIASLLCKYSFAQHCPFDGAHLIAIKAVGKNGKMMKRIPCFLFKRRDNEMADSRTSSPGLIKKQILTATQFKTDCNKRYDRNGYNIKRPVN